jgi:hypothetical protein
VVDPVFEFFGNFFLALILVGLFRFLWMVCGLLIQTKDGGNTLFAVVLPLSMLYLLVEKITPIESWPGFAAGLAAGGAVLFCVRGRKAG